MGGLDLRRDDEVDVELPLAPELDVLDVRGADHGGRPGRLEPRERACDEVRLVARRAGEYEVGVAHACVGERAPAGAVGLERRDVEALADHGEAGRIEVENGHVVLAVESLHDRRPHLAGADDEDLHGGRRVHPGEDARPAVLRYRRGMRRPAASPPPSLRCSSSRRARPRRRAAGVPARPGRRRVCRPGPGQAAPRLPGVLYVVEQGGLIRVVKAGKIQSSRSSTCARLVQAGGEQGLLGLAFAPDYATSRQFVIDYTDRNGDTRVVRYRSDGTKALPASATQLLFVDQPYSNHNGGMVATGRTASSTSAWETGLRRRPREPRTEPELAARQDPPARPGPPGAKPVIVADGVRNPWRFSFDRANGDLWIGDVGQGSIEEVDHVAWPWKGLLNFGWDVYEGRASFERRRSARAGSLPVAQYSHQRGCSITGGYVYRGRPCRRQGQVLLRRLLQRNGLVAQARQRCRPPDQARAVHGREPDLVRRGRSRRALRRLGRGQIYKLAS